MKSFPIEPPRPLRISFTYFLTVLYTKCMNIENIVSFDDTTKFVHNILHLAYKYQIVRNSKSESESESVYINEET